ncbi:MAG: NAD(P)-binding domain-containing protein, partial [Chitinophagaceae bacterium]
MKAAIIGAGNIGAALADGLLKSGNCKSNDITLTRRSIHSLQELADQGFGVSADNKGAILNADVIFLCVLPQQLNAVLAQLQDTIDPQKQLIVSVVTGVTTKDIGERLVPDVRIIRAMPNTAMRV